MLPVLFFSLKLVKKNNNKYRLIHILFFKKNQHLQIINLIKIQIRLIKIYFLFSLAISFNFFKCLLIFSAKLIESFKIVSKVFLAISSALFSAIFPKKKNYNHLLKTILKLLFFISSILSFSYISNARKI